MDEYALIDAGDGARLERFGDHVTDRPYAGALAPRRDPERWADADLRFDRERGWSARDGGPVVPWVVSLDGLTLELRPTDTGQVGLFPEHRSQLAWLRDRIAARPGSEPPDVLHLFAYTGLVTLALAQAGAAVAHVDASRPAVAWARVNAGLSELVDRPVRWLMDDARDFVAREVRRGRRYAGIVLDPPSYGHGVRGGRRWQIESDLPPLLDACRRLLADDGFVLLSTHTEELGTDGLRAMTEAAFGYRTVSSADTGELTLEAASGARLHLGAFIRWDARS